MPVITESLFARFSSRGKGDFAAKVNAALRNQFGGHAVHAGRLGGSGAAARGVAPMAVAEQKHEQENPLVEGLERLPVHPTTLVIFGATGDLAHRKLLPAIYNLAHEGALPGALQPDRRSSRSRDVATTSTATMARESIEQYSRREPDEQVLEKLLEQVRYVPGTFDDGQRLRAARRGPRRVRRARPGSSFNRVFYLSTAPSVLPGDRRAAGRARARQATTTRRCAW